MSQYIIDIPDNVKKIVYFHAGNANAVWITSNDLDNLELLTADYINEHYGDLQDDAYERGHGIGYQKGFEDGKAQSERGCEGCKYQANRELTCPCSECANKYKNQWKAKDDKIVVGDGVNGIYSKEKGVVTQVIGDTQVYVLWQGGSSGIWNVNEVTKTGRHFEINKVLEEIKGDNDK